MKGSYQLDSFTENRDSEITRLNSQVDLFFEKEFEAYTGFGLMNGMKIVDCGCGPGHLLRRILNKFPMCEATGLEVDPFLFKELSKNSTANNTKLFDVVEASVYNTGLPDNYFDFAITRLVIEHLNEPVVALREIYRILRPGGKLIVISNDFAYHLLTFPLIPELDEMYAAYCRSRYAEGGNPLAGRQIPQLLKKGNFSGIEMKVINVHSAIEGDKAILNAENVNISKSLVNDGYLAKETLDSLAVAWYEMLRNPDHSIYRQLFICCGEKNPLAAKLLYTSQEDHFADTAPVQAKADLTATSEIERETITTHFLENEVKRIMGVENLKIEKETKLNDIDIDSIGAAELSSIISKTFGKKVAISDILQKLSIGDLTAIILQKSTTDHLKQKDETGARKEVLQDQDYSSEISEIQEQFWILHKLFPNGAAYNIPSVLKLTGKLSLPAFEYSVNQVINRHEVLRARFYEKDNVVMQHVSACNTLEFKPEVTYINENFGPGSSLEIVLEEVHKKFDLSTWPLFRIRLFCYNNDVTIISIVFYHMIIDLHSRNIFSNELTQFYNSYLSGMRPVALAPANKYSDYSKTLRNWLSTDEAAAKTARWRNEIIRIEEMLRLPSDFIRTKAASQEGKRRYFSFSTTVSSKIRETAKHNSVNPFTILLSAFSILLYRITNQRTFAIGVPLTNRRMVEFNDTFGCFVNILPLIFDFTDDTTCSEVIAHTRRELLKAHVKQEVPFLRISKLVRSNGRDTVFQVGFTMETPMSLSLKDIDTKSIEIDKEGAQLDLFLTLWDNHDEIRGYLEYSTQLFSDKTAERFAEMFRIITGAITEKPYLTVSLIDIVPGSELRLITDWNDTDHNYSDNMCLHHKLELQAAKTPDLPAVVYGNSSLSYYEFDKHVNRLANFLRASGVVTEDIVCVCMERSPELLIAIYAIHKAGGAYLPVDPDYPQERLNLILSDARPRLILTNKASEKNIPSGNAKILLDNIIVSPLSDNSDSPVTGATSHNLAYVIYTSGSTGKPKGVMIEHHSVINKLEWMQHQHPLDKDDTIMLKTPVTFDVSVWEIFWWMFNGSKVAILPPGAEKDPASIIRETESKKVTAIVFVPSMFSAFVTYVKANRLSGRLASLKWIIQIGEALRPSLVNSFNELLTSDFNPLMVNTYGPTEATVAVSWYNCPKEKNVERIFIGKPVFNTKLLVMNNRFRLQPIGVPGELVITGVNLSRGYLNRPELNEERFITIDYPGDIRLKGYRTGDLVRWMDDGNIDFMGRLDTQVKIRGHRIELGDIESALNTFSKVKTSAVIVKDPDSENQSLAGYVVLKEKEASTPAEIKAFLLTKLPEYMIPSFILLLDEMPLNSSGKIDRKRLPRPEPGSLAEKVIPESAYEKKLHDIFSRVLGTDNIGVTHNFFDMGGNSLLAIRVVSEIREELNCPVEPIHLIEYPDIRRLAGFIAGLDGGNRKAQAAGDEGVRKRDFSGFLERRR